MKKLLTFLLPLIIVATIALTPSCALFQGKSPEVVAVNASDAAKITVEAALKSWNDFIPVGKPSQDQQRRVKAAYGQYKAAQLALLDSAIAYKTSKDAPAEARMSAAAAKASAALASLVSLIRQYGAKL